MGSTTGVSPELGLHTAIQIPTQVHRRTMNRPTYKRRVCHDNRPYVVVPFTIPGPVTIAKFGPQWRSDRDYWIAKVIAEVGRHDEALHPADGTPGGHDLTANMHRVDVSDDSDDQMILNSNGRLRIAENHHQDAVNDAEDGKFAVDDFNLHRLAEGDHIYPEVLAIGTSRPGTGLVVSIVLVPIP